MDIEVTDSGHNHALHEFAVKFLLIKLQKKLVATNWFQFYAAGWSLLALKNSQFEFPAIQNMK